MPDEFYTSFGLIGESGTSISPWTTLETILANKLQYILRGWVRIDRVTLAITTIYFQGFTLDGFFQQQQQGWGFFFTVCSHWIKMLVLKKFVASRPKSRHKVSSFKISDILLFSVTMCPLCANCSTWPLHQICDYTRIAYLFDHPGTVFYAVFMSFWCEHYS